MRAKSKSADLLLALFFCMTKERRMSVTNVWDGFANLLAELIEKHAAELSFDDMPTLQNTDSNDNNNNEHTDTILNVDKINSA